MPRRYLEWFEVSWVNMGNCWPLDLAFDIKAFPPPYTRWKVPAGDMAADCTIPIVEKCEHGPRITRLSDVLRCSSFMLVSQRLRDYLEREAPGEVLFWPTRIRRMDASVLTNYFAVHPVHPKRARSKHSIVVNQQEIIEVEEGFADKVTGAGFKGLRFGWYPDEDDADFYEIQTDAFYPEETTVASPAAQPYVDAFADLCAGKSMAAFTKMLRRMRSAAKHRAFDALIAHDVKSDLQEAQTWIKTVYAEDAPDKQFATLHFGYHADAPPYGFCFGAYENKPSGRPLSWSYDGEADDYAPEPSEISTPFFETHGKACNALAKKKATPDEVLFLFHETIPEAYSVALAACLCQRLGEKLLRGKTPTRHVIAGHIEMPRIVGKMTKQGWQPAIK